MATIQYWDATNSEWVHTCGGALIEPGRVVTAAHCMVYWGANASHGLTSYRVGLGYRDLTLGIDNPGSQTYTVTRVRRYYSYQFKTSDDPLHMKPRRDDLAMLSLSQNAEMTSSVSTIEVQKERIPDDYQVCYQFGWGGTETKGPFEEVAASNSLKKMVTVHIPNHVCRKLWGVADNNVYESQVCSWTWGVVDSSRKGNWCWLDNGGPMVCDNKLVGISNIGDPKCAGCFPEICTRLSYYNRWIRRVSQMP